MFTCTYLNSKGLLTGEAPRDNNVTVVMHATHHHAVTYVSQQAQTVIHEQSIDDSETCVVVMMGNSIPEVQGNLYV